MGRHKYVRPVHHLYIDRTDSLPASLPSPYTVIAHACYT